LAKYKNNSDSRNDIDNKNNEWDSQQQWPSYRKVIFDVNVVSVVFYIRQTYNKISFAFINVMKRA